ncbi:DUF5395 domain-containing protein [Archaeoglobus fulgidus]|uniref:Uncharacterized protein n=1 Tax=Archaeoglobus fulgidus DSM 8774 TaxID=1344584 RepID=A0A075WFR5_ARCFL|nr:DUF5395 domain-containing protein [Archaeoglobus fulgidus]AIG98622.1 hypothetical protein AFULGI_00018670 [Archaeoglobus fulgidus DSM 8774]
MVKLSFTLRFGDVWVAENGEIVAEGHSLDELDRNLELELRKAGYKGRVEVFMKFDYSTIPEWMRQFHPHYFNRTVVFDLD